MLPSQSNIIIVSPTHNLILLEAETTIFPVSVCAIAIPGFIFHRNTAFIIINGNSTSASSGQTFFLVSTATTCACNSIEQTSKHERSVGITITETHKHNIVFFWNKN